MNKINYDDKKISNLLKNLVNKLNIKNKKINLLIIITCKLKSIIVYIVQ